MYDSIVACGYRVGNSHIVTFLKLGSYFRSANSQREPRHQESTGAARATGAVVAGGAGGSVGWVSLNCAAPGFGLDRSADRLTRVPDEHYLLGGCQTPPAPRHSCPADSA